MPTYPDINTSVLIAKHFAQSGLPLAEMYKYVEQQGEPISWLNVCDEFRKMGFSQNRILGAMRELAHFQPSSVDIALVQEFIESPYKRQREMLWDYWKPHKRMLDLKVDQIRWAEWIEKYPDRINGFLQDVGALLDLKPSTTFTVKEAEAIMQISAVGQGHRTYEEHERSTQKKDT